MMHHRRIIAALIATFLASSIAIAQDVAQPTYNHTKFGQAGMKFLEIGLSARAEGMGGAVTGIDMGSASIFYNPAGMANPVGSMGDVFVARTQWVADIAINAAAASYKTPWVTVGVSFMSLDYGTVKGYRMTNAGTVESTGDLSLASSALGIGLARQVTDKFEVGVTARYVSEDLAATEGAKTTIFVFDAGTLYRTGLGSSVLSMSIRNFSRQARHQDEGYDLPLIFRIGVAMDVLNMQETARGPHGLVVSLDALHPRDRAEEALLGLEYNLMKMLYVRAATRVGHDYTGGDLSRGMTMSIASLGGGVRYKLGPVDGSFNYAWSNQGSLLGAVHRFDLQVGF